MSNVVLHHGDCLEVMAGMAAGSVDAIVTDPPYLTGESGITQNHSRIGTVYRPSTAVGLPWGYSLDWIDIAATIRPRHWIVFANFKMLGGLCAALECHAEISAVFVWRKSNAPRMARPVPRLDCEFIVWARKKGESCGRMGEFQSLVIDVPMLQAGVMATERICERGSGKAVHPCQKPLAVVLPFVDRLPIESVLDPFAGTGTTGVACRKSGRRCVLIEDDVRYIPIIRRRLKEAETPLFQNL
jgi:site-specific DNA-methyltransferase (adenine-specific)